MGPATFIHYHDGAEVGAAFHDARAIALHDRGHGGDTGTIAEKHSYVIITETAMDYDDAYDHAAHLIEIGDQRIDDKHGPAGAIPAKKATRIVTVDNAPAPGFGTLTPDDLDRIIRIARHRNLIADSDTVASGWWEDHHDPASQRPVRVAQLRTAKDPAALAAQATPDGWVFFGWANY